MTGINYRCNWHYSLQGAWGTFCSVFDYVVADALSGETQAVDGFNYFMREDYFHEDDN